MLDPVQVKGLEFDAVVLVEPSDIATGPSGASDLYVAMTRPTQRLVVVHARALPAGVAGTGPGAETRASTPTSARAGTEAAGGARVAP